MFTVYGLLLYIYIYYAEYPSLIGISASFNFVNISHLILNLHNDIDYSLNTYNSFNIIFIFTASTILVIKYL